MYKFLCERMVSFLLDVHLVLEFWGYMITFIWASLVAQDGKEYACNAGELSSIHGKIPWRREWLPTPVFLPGKYHGQAPTHFMVSKAMLSSPEGQPSV